jgi:hypothetical protein
MKPFTLKDQGYVVGEYFPAEPGAFSGSFGINRMVLTGDDQDAHYNIMRITCDSREQVQAIVDALNGIKFQNIADEISAPRRP